MTEAAGGAGDGGTGLMASIAVAEAIPVTNVGPALAATLEVLQHLTVDRSLLPRAEIYFSRLLLYAFDADASVLDRLLREERTAVLSPALQRALACLRALVAGDLILARQLLPALLASGTPAERVLASRLLLQDQRVSEALLALTGLDEAPERPSFSPAAAHLAEFLDRRARARLAPQPAEGRVLLTLCAALRNEAPYLAEWIAYHDLIGVERFCLYENESSDDTRAELARLARHFRIEVVPWKRQPANVTAFEDYVERSHGRSEWVACLDADEFLVPAVGVELRDLLSKVPAEVAAVVLNWRIFGSAGYQDRPPGLALEHYCRRAPDGFWPNRHVKSIVRPARAIHPITTHQFLALGRQVDATLAEVFPLAGQVAPPRYEGLWINHYIVRSRADHALKRARGHADIASGRRRELPESYFDEFDRNEVADRSVERFLPALRAALAALG